MLAGRRHLRLVEGGDVEVVRGFLDVPISRVGRARFGWYVGCRDGFLYTFNQIGELLWRWETPGLSSFRLGDSSDSSLRPSPYHLVTNGKEALVGSWGSVWCVSSEGETLWSAVLASLDGEEEPASFPSTRDDAAATDIELVSMRRDGPRFHTHFGFHQRVTTVLVEGDDWLVCGSAGDLFRFSKDGQLKMRISISTSSVVPIHDIGGSIAAFGSQPNLWFIDRDEPVRLPDAYQWPSYLQAGCGDYVLSHRHGDRHLGLINEEGRLSLQVRCPRSITSIDVGEEALAFVAASLVVLGVPGLSAEPRRREWHPLLLGNHEPQTQEPP